MTEDETELARRAMASFLPPLCGTDTAIFQILDLRRRASKLGTSLGWRENRAVFVEEIRALHRMNTGVDRSPDELETILKRLALHGEVEQLEDGSWRSTEVGYTLTRLPRPRFRRR